MLLKQEFSQMDLEELYQVLSKSTEVKHRSLRFWLRHRKAYQNWLIGLAILLFAASAFLITRIRWFSLMIAVIGLLTLLYVFTWTKVTDKFLNPEKMIQRYKVPFVVEMEGNTFHFGQFNFTVSDIDYIVEYKYFLLIRGNRRWFFMKAGPEEKARILSWLNDYPHITLMKIKEPVDLRQFR